MKQDTQPENENMPKEMEPETKQPPKPWLRFGLTAVGLAVVGLTALLIFNSDKISSTSYLTNDNHVACVWGAKTLECEDLQTGEVQEFMIPNRYGKMLPLSVSPDGTKFVMKTSNNEVVVTDTSFNEIRVIFKADELKDRYPSYTWVSGSEQILISEIGREANDESFDAEFLPEPLVVRLFNIETGESHRVYKTGEREDIDSITVLGGNDEYVFVSLPTTKNWVAKETAPPSDTLQAIRLSDGLVRPISTYQIDVTDEENVFSYKHSAYYDSNRDLFVFTENGLMVARLKDGRHGLMLHKVYKSSIDGWSLGLAGGRDLVFTSQGVWKEGGDQFELINDAGSITTLKFPAGKFLELLSLKSMPNLPKATAERQ